MGFEALHGEALHGEALHGEALHGEVSIYIRFAITPCVYLLTMTKESLSKR